MLICTEASALLLLQLGGDVERRVAGLHLLHGHGARPIRGLGGRGSTRGQRYQLSLPLHDLVLQEARHRRRLAAASIRHQLRYKCVRGSCWVKWQCSERQMQDAEHLNMHRD